MKRRTQQVTGRQWSVGRRPSVAASIAATVGVRRRVGIIRLAYLCALCVIAALVAGCEDSQNATVTGVVTFDSKPLERGIVTFVAVADDAGTPASGQIQEDGSYMVQIGQSGQVVAAEYVVAVASRAPSIANPNGGPPTPGTLLTPERYSNVKTSGLRYHIRPGGNTIDIALAPVALPQPESAGNAKDDQSTALDESTSADEKSSARPTETTVPAAAEANTKTTARD